MFPFETIRVEIPRFEHLAFWDSFWPWGWVAGVGILVLVTAFCLAFDDLPTTKKALSGVILGVIFGVIAMFFVSFEIYSQTNLDYSLERQKQINSSKLNAKSIARDRILEEYKLDKDSVSFEHTISNSILKESSTTYDDLENKTRYELVFVFDNDGKPNLMKTLQVDALLIAKLEKSP
jgi:hypothetical protein